MKRLDDRSRGTQEMMEPEFEIFWHPPLRMLLPVPRAASLSPISIPEPSGPDSHPLVHSFPLPSDGAPRAFTGALLQTPCWALATPSPPPPHAELWTVPQMYTPPTSAHWLLLYPQFRVVCVLHGCCTPAYSSTLSSSFMSSRSLS